MTRLLYIVALNKILFLLSVTEPEPPGAATFRMEPGPIFLMAGAFFKTALAAFFWQAKRVSLVLVMNVTQEQFIKVPVNMIPKRLAIMINF